MFVLIKKYPNHFGIELETVKVCKDGKYLDDTMANIGECELDIDDEDYWELDNVCI